MNEASWVPDRILVYKRTHFGDPNLAGVFGCHRCMGSVRGKQFDAVIGVGGVGDEPKRHGIDRLITWVGVGASRHASARTDDAHPTVTFDRFCLYNTFGVPLDTVAPMLARRMYGEPGYYHHVRYVLNLLPEERLEALQVLDLTLSLDWQERQSRWTLADRQAEGARVSATPPRP
jgi:hypothetical protein